MSHSLTPTPVAITSTTLPDDGDLASAASVNTPITDTANGVKYCQDSIDGTSTGTMVPQDINVGAGGFYVNATDVVAGLPFTAAGAVTCVSTLESVGAVTCDTILHVIGTTTAAGINCTSITRSGSFSAIGSSVTVSSKLVMGGPTVLRYVAAVGDSNQSINCTTTDVFSVEDGTITADRNGTITNGADAGQIIRIVSHESGNTLSLKNADTSAILDTLGTQLKVVANPGSDNEFKSVLLMWLGSFWYFVGQ